MLDAFVWIRPPRQALTSHDPPRRLNEAEPCIEPLRSGPGGLQFEGETVLVGPLADLCEDL